MAHFLRTVSATFAAGMVCGAGALIALAPAPVRDVPQADQAQPEKAPPPVAVLNQTSIPCKDQVWPNIDRRCMRWTAERWTAKSGGNNDGTESQPPVNLETAGAPAPETRAAAKPAAPPTTAQAKSTPQPTAQPETRRAETAKTVAPQPAPQPVAPQPAPQPAAQSEPAQQQAAASPAGDARPSQQSQQQTRKATRSKSRVARSREREDFRDYRDSRDSRDTRDGRDYRDYRDSRRIARAWGEDDADYFTTRRVIIRQQPARQDSFFLFGN
jgi:hypothetical protein